MSNLHKRETGKLYCDHCDYEIYEGEKWYSKSNSGGKWNFHDDCDPSRINIKTGLGWNTDPTHQRMSGITAHGNIPFDVPFINEIDTNLWQGGCQNGLELPHFIKHLVSLYRWEGYQVKHALKSYFVVEMYDSLEQSTDEVETIAQWVNVARLSGPVLVHCQAGLNRSSLIVGRALMLGGMTADEAINHLRTKRSPAVLCNKSFEDYLRSK